MADDDALLESLERESKEFDKVVQPSLLAGNMRWLTRPRMQRSTVGGAKALRRGRK